jgi:hypothetical protein
VRVIAVGIALFVVSRGGFAIASSAGAGSRQVEVVPGVSIRLLGGWHVLQRFPDQQVVLLEGGPCRLDVFGSSIAAPTEVFGLYVEQTLKSQLSPLRVQDPAGAFSTSLGLRGVRGLYEGLASGNPFVGEVSVLAISQDAALLLDAWSSPPFFDECIFEDARRMINSLEVVG